MTVTLKLSETELQVLTSLAADQLFRREFIDSRLPGFGINAPELAVGTQLVQRMRSAAGVPSSRLEAMEPSIAPKGGVTR